jgi:hypothetical protein
MPWLDRCVPPVYALRAENPRKQQAMISIPNPVYCSVCDLVVSRQNVT